MPRADSASGTGARRQGRAPRRKTPPPTLVLLVRHGATPTTGKALPGRAPGLHLSDRGREQAEAVATRIAALRNGDRARVTAVYASPLERTLETAEAIAGALGHAVQTEEGLLELDIGEWTGLDLKSARKRAEWATIHRYPSGFRFPGGESFVDMQSRVIATLTRLRGAHPGETVVAVSHADPIRAVVAHAMGTHLDLFHRVLISPCSLTAIALGNDGPIVLTVNSTGDPSSITPS